MHIARIANARATDATLAAVVIKGEPLLFILGGCATASLTSSATNNLGACIAHTSAAHCIHACTPMFRPNAFEPNARTY